MKNAFGQDIPEIKELIKIDSVRDYIEGTLVSVLNALDINSPSDIVTDIFSVANNSISDYELQAHELLTSKGVTKTRIGDKLSGRAELIYNQIKGHVKGKVLDLGCGDGKVSERLAKDGLEVVLADIYQHEHVKETGLPFHQFRQGEQTTLQDQYDTVLLLTVMHHSDNPVTGYKNAGTLEEGKRLTKEGGKIIAIESVYGIDPGQGENAESFSRLSHEDQRLTNIFFDHFYNRVIHYSQDPNTKVNVPFNFNTPDGWNKEAENLGLRVITTKLLGIDQVTVPEFHTLHVYEA